MDAETQYRLGIRLWQEGAREAAIAAFAQAVAHAADHADALNSFGNALLEVGRPQEAVAALREVAALRPDHAPARYNLGNALLAAGEAEAAVDEFRAALRCDPEHAGAYNNLGNALRALGRVAEAAESYHAAVARLPNEAGAHNNLAAALLALHRPAEAAAVLQAALRCDANHADACNNLGGALLALDRPEAALPWFRQAAALDAQLVQARFGESLALLALGRFREGWDAYESRWLDPQFCKDERPYDRPLWRGLTEPLAGRTLLLHAEQGLGDTIQFARYAPLLRRRGARVVLEVQAPLVTLLRDLADEVIAAGADLPPYDAHCPLLSLPRAFATELPTVPADIPYLQADPDVRARWRERLGARPRIGLVLSGSAEHPEDALRSIPAETLRPLLAQPGFDVHVVQTDLRDADAAVLRAYPQVRIHAGQLGNFADTAGLLAELDLLVSVDTSVAHLAGALGLPVWLLVQSNADFRWLRVRTDNPWYPTMRLFRQATMLRWAPVVARVAQALRARYDAS